jgi:hypothetical protein
VTPWGGADDYIRLVSPLRSQMKTSLCDNQHNAAVEILEEYPKRTGLPREEYFDHPASAGFKLAENHQSSAHRGRE